MPPLPLLASPAHHLALQAVGPLGRGCRRDPEDHRGCRALGLECRQLLPQGVERGRLDLVQLDLFCQLPPGPGVRTLPLVEEAVGLDLTLQRRELVGGDDAVMPRLLLHLHLAAHLRHGAGHALDHPRVGTHHGGLPVGAHRRLIKTPLRKQELIRDRCIHASSTGRGRPTWPAV